RDSKLDALPALLSLPQTGGDAVHEEEAHSGGAFVPSAPVRGDLLPNRLRDELIPLAEAHDVHVVFGQQPNAAFGFRNVRVAGEAERAAALHVDLFGSAGIELV